MVREAYCIHASEYQLQGSKGKRKGGLSVLLVGFPETADRGDVVPVRDYPGTPVKTALHLHFFRERGYFFRELHIQFRVELRNS